MMETTVRTLSGSKGMSHSRGDPRRSVQEVARTRTQSDNSLRSFNGLLPLSVVENVELPLLLIGIGVAQARRRAQEALDLVGLTDYASLRPPDLSRDQRQRLMVARTLANKPAFDNETSAEAMEALCQLVKNRG